MDENAYGGLEDTAELCTHVHCGNVTEGYGTTSISVLARSSKSSSCGLLRTKVGMTRELQIAMHERWGYVDKTGANLPR